MMRKKQIQVGDSVPNVLSLYGAKFSVEISTDADLIGQMVINVDGIVGVIDVVDVLDDSVQYTDLLNRVHLASSGELTLVEDSSQLWLDILAKI